MQVNHNSKIKNQKSVVVCCNSFPPEKGGAPTRIYNMAALLRDAGYAVTVITAMPNYPTGKIFPGYRGRLIHKEVLDGIEVIRLGLLPSNSSSFLLRGMSMISFLLSIFFLAGPRLFFRKADLVIVSSPPLISAWLFALLSKFGKKKLLVNISDIWPLTALEMGALKQGATYKFLKRLEGHLYKMADAFTGQSLEILAHLKSSLKINMPSFLYRNLQDEKTAAKNTNAGRMKAFKIIYAGNLGHAQGMYELCKGINFTALDAELHIYGAGAERAILENFVKEHPHNGLFLYPTIPQKELDALLPCYDAVLIPLKIPIYGAVPSKLFMAVAAGLPVLFCAGGEGAMMVEEHKLGLVAAPGDYRALAGAVKEMAGLAGKELLKLQTSIATAARTLYSKPQQDAAFIQFISDLLSGKDKSD